MTLNNLKATLTGTTPPSGLSPLLLALWHDAKGDWDAPHRVAQDVDDENGAWVHAYLHRKEGDASNADYWYVRPPRRPHSRRALNEEWDEIASALSWPRYLIFFSSRCGRPAWSITMPMTAPFGSF